MDGKTTKASFYFLHPLELDERKAHKCKMTTTVKESVLPAFGISGDRTEVKQFGSGLINHTWRVQTGNRTFILQRINDTVFTQPHNIEHNIKVIAAHLGRYHPNYCFAAPLPALDGSEMIHQGEAGFFRVFPFIQGSHSIDVVESPEQALEAAVQFGRFTRLLSGVDVHLLKITIPSFHDLTLRFSQFQSALKKGNGIRVRAAQELIADLLRFTGIVDDFERIKITPAFKWRVTHHDTKISNVLFDQNNRGLCVIDLDTVMPGYFISDVGDMMRTYLPPVSEEEADFDKISVRDEIYAAIVQGYYREMKGELTGLEKNHFLYAGKFMIYMQALRFLTDHLNDDVYYGAKYEGHNFVRAGNQVTLLKRLVEKEPVLTRYHSFAS